MSVFRGIFETVQQYPNTGACRILPDKWMDQTAQPDAGRSFDALIVRMNQSYIQDKVLSTRIPVVNVSGMLKSAPFPLVTVDNAEVGEMAARYLAGRGLRRFAFCGDESGFSVAREKAFATAIARMGKKYYPLICPGNRSIGWFQGIQDILKEPDSSPLGVFVVNDDAADTLMEILRFNGIQIPSSVAVLGVDNEELAQNRASPPLSSIEVPTYGIGCEAVHLAIRMMDGAKDIPSSILLPPSRVIARASTDVLAAENLFVRDAISYIRKNAANTIGIDDIVAAVGAVGKRTLQRAFVEELGAPIQDYIHSVRLDLCKELLEQDSLSIKEVAFRAGFASQSRLTRFFSREAGYTPKEYRNRLHTPDPDPQ